MMNCGELTACRTVMSDCGSPVVIPDGSPSNNGGRRTSSAAGIISIAVRAAIINIEVRQSWIVTSHAASGAMVIGAIPMPAETNETARPRCVSNQPVTQAIMGARMAAVDAPVKRPN
jgi:hypothetical protein